MGGIGTALEPIGRGIEAADKIVPGAKRVGQTALDIATLLGARAPVQAQIKKAGAANAGRQAIAESQKVMGARTPEEIRKALGVKVRASDIEAQGGKPTVGARMKEMVGGSARTGRENVLHNRGAVDRAVGGDLGVPDGKLSPKKLVDLEAPHAAVYREVKKVPAAPLSEQALRAIRDAGSSASARPPPAGIARERANLLAAGPLSGEQLLKTISELRAEATANLSPTAPGAKLKPNRVRLGKAQQQMADALDKQLEQIAGPDLGARYKGAREGFAKINTVRRSLDGNHVDPQKLGRETRRNKGVEGATKAVGETARHYPDAMRSKVPAETEAGTGRTVARAVLGASSGGLSEVASLLTRKLGNKAPKAQLGREGPLKDLYRQPKDPGPSGPPKPNADQALSAQIATGAPASFMDEVLAQPEPAVAPRVEGAAQLPPEFDINAPRPSFAETIDAQLGGAPAPTTGTFADILAELEATRPPQTIQGQLGPVAPRLEEGLPPPTGSVIDEVLGGEYPAPDFDTAALPPPVGAARAPLPAAVTNPNAPPSAIQPDGMLPQTRKLYRGVPEGQDPLAFNDFDTRFLTNDEAVASQYGKATPHDVDLTGWHEAGGLDELRTLAGVPPDADVPTIMRGLITNTRLKGVSYPLPPGIMDDVPPVEWAQFNRGVPNKGPPQFPWE